MYLDDKPPTAAAAPAGATDPQAEEVKTIRIVNLYFECQDKPNLCAVREWLKSIGKKVSPDSLTKINGMIEKFKSSIKTENLNPKIFDIAFVVQARQNSTHTTKTYLMTVADHTKLQEVLGFINEKFQLSQTGLIRDKIWANKKAASIDEGQ